MIITCLSRALPEDYPCLAYKTTYESDQYLGGGCFYQQSRRLFYWGVRSAYKLFFAAAAVDDVAVTDVPARGSQGGQDLTAQAGLIPVVKFLVQLIGEYDD